MSKHCGKIWILLLFISLTGCQSDWDQALPKNEIIFQAAYREEQKVLGTANKDGSELEVMQVGELLKKPIWSSDGRMIYALVKSVGLPGLTAGYPAYWAGNGEFGYCSTWGNALYLEPFDSENNLRIIVAFSREIKVVDLFHCKTEEVLFDVGHGINSDMNINSIMGISYREETNELLYGVEVLNAEWRAEYQIMKMNIETGDEVTLGVGIHPAWSPDGSEIAYIGDNGIYIANSDGGGTRMLVEHPFADSKSSMRFWNASTSPHWSPDGNWIIYHRCERVSCLLHENTIFRVSAKGGPEEVIVVGGAYPSLR